MLRFFTLNKRETRSHFKQGKRDHENRDGYKLLYGNYIVWIHYYVMIKAEAEKGGGGVGSSLLCDF